MGGIKEGPRCHVIHSMKPPEVASAQSLPLGSLGEGPVPTYPSQPRSDSSLVGATQARVDIFRERERYFYNKAHN